MRTDMQCLWDEKLKNVLGHYKRKELRKMVAEGEAIVICQSCLTIDKQKKLCGGRSKQHTWVYRDTGKYQSSERVSPASISFRENMANAGLSGSRREVRAARRKVRNYRMASTEDKNPLPSSGFFKAKKRAKQKDALIHPWAR